MKPGWPILARFVRKGGNSSAAGSVPGLVDRIGGIRCRKVPHRGFATVQDDIDLWLAFQLRDNHCRNKCVGK